MHEYFRQLTAVLISEDTAWLAKDPVNLILNFGDVVITLSNKEGENTYRFDEVLACKKKGKLCTLLAVMHFY